MRGDIKTGLSCFVMGLGQMMRGQWVKGLAYLTTEIFFTVYMLKFGGMYLLKITPVEMILLDSALKKEGYSNRQIWRCDG